MRRCSLFAIIACLSLPISAYAAPEGSMPAVTATSNATAQPAQAVQAPVVYLVQAQAAAQPAAVAPAQTPSGGSALLTLATAIPGEVWGALLGALATLLFSFWKGTAADKARNLVLQFSEGAWYVAERSGGSGAAKLEAACDVFHKSLTGAGLTLDTKTIAVRDSVFTGMSAADKVARMREEVRSSAAAQAASEPKPETAGAILDEAARG